MARPECPYLAGLAIMSCLLFIQLSSGQQDTLQQFINRKEQHVKNIAALVKAVWNESCSDLANSCVASRVNCANDLGSGLTNKTCTFPTYAAHFADDTCPCNRTQFSFDEGFVRLAKYMKADDPQIMQSICRTRKLDTIYKTIFEGDPDQLQIYFGLVNGVFRKYPGGPRKFSPPDAPRDTLQEVINNCAAYDPRNRPWFLDAVLGPKSIVILLEVSGDMNEDYAKLGTPPTNLDVAKAMVRTILQTLHTGDYFSVVTFASTATTLNSTTGPRLFVWDEGVNATIFQLLDAVTAIDKNAPGGTERNFKAAFAEAFTALNSTTPIRCDKKMIILIAEGDDTSGQPEALLSYINASQASLWSTPANILTYSLLVTTTNGPLLSSIACANRGVFTNIAVDVSNGVAGAELGMHKFLVPYFVLGGSGEEKIFWTEGYLSATAREVEMTAAMPVKDAMGNLIGVVGVDTSPLQVRVFEGGVQRISELSTSAQKDCRPDIFTDCDIQNLRQYNDYLLGSAVSVCTPAPANCSYTPPSCDINLTTDKVYAPVGAPVSYESKFCCKDCLSLTAPSSSTPSPGGPTTQSKTKFSIPAVIGVSIAALIAFTGVVLFVIYAPRLWNHGMQPNSQAVGNSGTGRVPTDKAGIMNFFK